jgi:hypothetical protein
LNSDRENILLMEAKNCENAENIDTTNKQHTKTSTSTGIKER